MSYVRHLEDSILRNSNDLEEHEGNRILIVDDEKTIRQSLSDILRSWGYHVVVANSGLLALALFLRKPFDLVLTDLTMSGIDGGVLAAHVKKRSPDTPVGLMTAQDRESVSKRLEGSCIDFVLFKPFTLEEFKERVVRTLSDRALH